MFKSVRVTEKKCRFQLIYGFLGAGKTTLMGQLAREYGRAGLRVALLTNDQAPDLVDTATLLTEGVPVKEVAGSCFCCNFPTMLERIEQLKVEERPDIILAEPVGSCTDLQATIVAPLAKLYPDSCEVGPLLGVVDPLRARRLLTPSAAAGLSSKAAYIWGKQIEECDLLALNKLDLLSDEETAAVVALFADHWPWLPVVPISARSGAGLDALRNRLNGTVRGGRILDIDYDIYAEGEAELGWLNARLTFSGTGSIDQDTLLRDLMGGFALALRAEAAEVAHLKMLAEAGGKSAVANMVRGDAEPELSRTSGACASRIEVTVNARVQTSPEVLSEVLDRVATAVSVRRELAVERGVVRSFRPGRPVPTHRLERVG